MKQDEEEKVIVCATLVELPAPPVMASVKHCADCNARVWLSDSSPQDMTIICPDCFEVRCKKEPNVRIIMPTETQLADIIDYYGRGGE